MKRITLTTEPQPDYELLDSGGEEKLERFGEIILARPDPQTLWPERFAASDWGLASSRYIRKGEKWKWVPSKSDLLEGWLITFGGLKFIIKITSFKHTGLFPEQLSNWEWLTEILRKSKISEMSKSSAEDFVTSAVLGRQTTRLSTSPHPSFAPKVLNLFAYTGGATLAAAQAGAEVAHVDASKTAVAWARENAEASGFADKPVRWIVEDVLVFARREIKRGNKYDAIIMDPPAFGHGPKNELWKIEENFIELVKLCGQLLSEKPLFFLISGYAAGYSPLAFAYNLENIQKKFGGTIEFGDLTIAESNSERLLPAGIFARWNAGD